MQVPSAGSEEVRGGKEPCTGRERRRPGPRPQQAAQQDAPEQGFFQQGRGKGKREGRQPFLRARPRSGGQTDGPSGSKGHDQHESDAGAARQQARSETGQSGGEAEIPPRPAFDPHPVPRHRRQAREPEQPVGDGLRQDRREDSGKATEDQQRDDQQGNAELARAGRSCQFVAQVSTCSRPICARRASFRSLKTSVSALGKVSRSWTVSAGWWRYLWMGSA